MTLEQLRDRVDWTVQDTPPEVVLGRRLAGLVHLVSAVVTLGADAAGGRRAPDWSLPADPDAFVGLGIVELDGRSDLLPAPPLGAQLVSATQRDVWLTPARTDRPQHRVPVERFRVVGAVPRTGSRRPRHAEAPWTLTLTDGSGTVTLSGAWLALAWIGHLAGWPEPAPGGTG